MSKGYVNFPVNGDYTLIESAKTIVNLIVYDSLAATSGLDVEDYNTHLFLTGNFVSDDMKNLDLIDSDLSIDDLVDEQMRNGDYAKLYFPNYELEGMDIMKYLSTPLLSSTVIGVSDIVYEKQNGTFWRATLSDLDDNGKRLFGLMCNLYPDKDVRILTFVDDII